MLFDTAVIDIVSVAAAAPILAAVATVATGISDHVDSPTKLRDGGRNGCYDVACSCRTCTASSCWCNHGIYNT